MCFGFITHRQGKKWKNQIGTIGMEVLHEAIQVRLAARSKIII